MPTLLQWATHYKRLGLSVVATGADKSSIHYWKAYRYKLIHDDILENVFSRNDLFGIAVVCGKISGDLEVIDMDAKYDSEGTLFEQFIRKIDSIDSTLLSRLVIASTGNKGFHFFYRCSEISHYNSLARRPATMEELTAHPQQKFKVLLEKMGEGNYIIVPPTPGYTFIQHGLEKIPLIIPAQREQLLNIAKSFNQSDIPELDTPRRRHMTVSDESPFDAYDQSGDVIGLLQRHGWTKVKTVGPQIYFRRPGDTDHETSGDYHKEMGLFTVFTPNTIFNRLQGYRPYAVYALLECDGDFKRAAKQLLSEGYGTPYRLRKRRTGV